MNMHRKLILALLMAGVVVSAQNEQSKPKYQDYTASPADRAADLVSRMSLEEKIGQMQNSAPAIPQLGIPAYDWWNEALHGVARSGLATVFPQAIGLAATWDTDLEHRMADIISTEARGKYNDAIAHNNHQRYYGLTFWSPNINIFRDPRWGRGQETYGEDPYLTAQMALAFIRGMQGTDPHYFKTIATSKHFAVHSGPEELRHKFDVKPDQHDLESTYLYAFRATLSEGGADSVMCAYNAVDGVPACANTVLLKDYLRDKWHFQGYVVSDCDAVSDIYLGHHYTGSMAEAAAKAVQAGTDLDCGTSYKALGEAVQKGYIKEEEINHAVERLFIARFRLGMFDPPDRVPFSKIGIDQVATPAHDQVSLEASEKSMVLLKNADHMLPLERVPRNIAVIGPAADDPDALLGNYNGIPPHIVTPLEGIERKFASRSHVRFALGSPYVPGWTSLVPQNVLTPAHASGGNHGLLVQYFKNEDFSGTPALSRVEPRGYFLWDMHDPQVTAAVPKQSFSMRWSGTLKVTQTGDYELGVRRSECHSCGGTDRAEIFIDGQPFLQDTQRPGEQQGARTAKLHLEAGRAYQIRVDYVQQGGGAGLELVWKAPEDALLREAMDAVKQSDLAILCIGLNSRLEGEESPIDIPGFDHGDRTNINLPNVQKHLLQSVLDSGKPVIVVLINGSALAVNLAKERAGAILEAWYPGQDGGTAIANTLAGENNPAGRLPITFYESADQLPPFTDYSMKNRTYRYFTGKPLYPFGYGLSYSDFQYSDIAVRNANNGVEASARVTNRSSRDGDEVVQLYLKDANGNLELRGFQRVHLRQGESRNVSFALNEADVQNAKSISIGGGQPLADWTGNHFLEHAPRP